MADAWLQRGCPACGSTRLDPRRRLASQPAAEEVSLEDLRASWRGFFRDGKLFFTFRTCADCGQVYCPNYFTPDQLARLYGQMDDNTGGQDAALMARAQRGYWDLLRAYASPPPGGYMELGPDIGLFTREAMAHPALDFFWMVEPNAAVHPALDRLLTGRPHQLFGDLEQVGRIPDGSLSLVVAIHVLDHLLEPHALLERLARKLKPGGILLAVTHNERSLVARSFGARWPACCLQHPQLYSPRTLTQAYLRAGLANVRVERTTNYFPVAYLLRHFFFAARLGAIELPLPASWSIGLKLGNIAALGTRP